MEEQNRYATGKIYKIIDNTTGKCYVGSTISQYLSQRLGKHREEFKSWKKDKCNYITSFEILENNNYEIVLIESYPCLTKDQLHSRERYWIETTECVNKYLPTRSKKEYNESYKERSNELHRIRHQSNMLNEEFKKQRQEHQLNYYHENKEKINARRRELRLEKKSNQMV